MKCWTVANRYCESELVTPAWRYIAGASTTGEAPEEKPVSEWKQLLHCHSSYSHSSYGRARRRSSSWRDLLETLSTNTKYKIQIHKYIKTNTQRQIHQNTATAATVQARRGSAGAAGAICCWCLLVRLTSQRILATPEQQRQIQKLKYTNTNDNFKGKIRLISSAHLGKEEH